MSSNFVANGYSNLEKEVRKNIRRKYELDLRDAGFIDRLKIKHRINIEINMELMKLREEVSTGTLFLKK